MEKPAHEENADVICRLLRRINQGIDPMTLRKEANLLISSVTARDIASAEKKLISDGYPQKLAAQLSAAFILMGVLEGRTLDVRRNLPANHVLRLVFAEHEMIRCFLADLADVTEEITAGAEISSASPEFMKLCHITEHLNAMEEHIEREEDIIFPHLQKNGWTTLCRAARSDHSYIRIAVDDLIRLITTFDPQRSREFVIKLDSITKYLCPALTEHLFGEDNILFPIALEVVADKTAWKRIKEVCDQIGYCGLHT
jgi:hypothetical protein